MNAIRFPRLFEFLTRPVHHLFRTHELAGVTSGSATGGTIEPLIDTHHPSSLPRVLIVMLRSEEHIYGGARCMLTFLEHQRHIHPIVVVCATSAHDPAVQELGRIGVPHELVVIPELRAVWSRPGLLGKLHRIRQIVQCNRQVMRIIQIHQPDIVHLDAEAVLLAGPAAKLSGRKLVHHLRGMQPTKTVSWVRQLAMAVSDRNVAVSESLGGFYRDCSHPLLRSRIAARLTSVYDPIRLDEIDGYAAKVSVGQARQDLGIPPGEIAIGLIGGIFSAKGYREFLASIAPRVASQCPLVRFYFVGGVKDDAYFASCKALVHEHSLVARVSFVGYQQNVYQWYRALDLLAFPSIREGFPGVPVEAQAFGVPIVASDIVGVRDAVAQGVGGFVTNDQEEFVHYLVRLANDRALRKKMGSRGQEYVQRFALDKVVRDLEAVHASLHTRGRRTRHSL